MNELHVPDAGHNLGPFRMTYGTSNCKIRRTLFYRIAGTEETLARPFRTPPDPVCYTKESILMKESQSKGIPACRSVKGEISFNRDLEIGHEIGASF